MTRLCSILFESPEFTPELFAAYEALGDKAKIWAAQNVIGRPGSGRDRTLGQVMKAVAMAPREVRSDSNWSRFVTQTRAVFDPSVATAKRDLATFDPNTSSKKRAEEISKKHDAMQAVELAAIEKFGAYDCDRQRLHAVADDALKELEQQGVHLDSAETEQFRGMIIRRCEHSAKSETDPDFNEDEFGNQLSRAPLGTRVANWLMKEDS